MTPLWLLPGAVVLVGGAVVAFLLRAAAEESKLLHAELVRQREVGSSLRRLESSLRALSLPQRAHR